METSHPEFAAFIGIDWADRKHDVCLVAAGADTSEPSVLEHRPAAIEAWATGLRERFGGRKVAVCIELAHGPIVSALLEHDIFVLFPVNPSTLAKYRQAFAPSRAKDDPTDAQIALELLLRHRDKLSMLKPDSAAMRALRRMVIARRELVEDRVRLTNRITNALKQFFPQVLYWFREKHTAVFIAFLERWPTLQAAQRAKSETLVAFFHAHNVRRADAVARRVEAIRSERPLTTDRAVIAPFQLLVAALLGQLRAVTAAIERFDDEIAERSKELADYRLFAALPGAGAALAPRLLVAFGERRERFPDAAALQKYAGVAPVTERSGNQSWVHWRFSCSKFIRQTFVEWTEQTITGSFWARAFYERHRAQGAAHNAAVRALAFKWIRILWRCWVDRVPYDESRYLSALQERGSPIIQFAAQNSSSSLAVRLRA
jgi:transposase